MSRFTSPVGSGSGGGVSSVSGTAPIVSSGGTAPAISVTVGTAANTVAAGNDARLNGLPQSSKSASYTLVLTDAGSHLYMTVTGQTITIPANGTVAFPIGSAVTVVNAAAVSTSIAITTDTMYLAGVGTTGTRTLSAFGMATLLKITATSWIASGNGLA